MKSLEDFEDDIRTMTGGVNLSVGELQSLLMIVREAHARGVLHGEEQERMRNDRARVEEAVAAWLAEGKSRGSDIFSVMDRAGFVIARKRP